MNVELLIARLERRLGEVKHFQSLIDVETRKTGWMLCEGEIVSLTNTLELIKEMNDVQSID